MSFSIALSLPIYLRIYFLLLFFIMCMCVGMCILALLLWRPEETVGFPRAGVTGGDELSDVGVGN